MPSLRYDGAIPIGSPIAGVALLKRYSFDWLLLIALIVLDVILNIIHPYQRYVDTVMLQWLMYPLKSNSVPSAAVPVIGLVTPFFFLLLFFLLKRDKVDLHQSILGLLFAVALTAVVTDSLKNAVGRPRPDFAARCFPNGTAIFQADGNVACTGIGSVIREGHKSFPSGHSSWSFSGLGYFSFFLAGKLETFDGSGHMTKVTLSALPLVGATAVGVSRVDDYWHFWTDVVTGAVIGLVLAYLTYRQFYPPLTDPRCSTPLIKLMASPESAADVEGGRLSQAGAGGLQHL